MVDRWSGLDEADDAFPYEWVEQCEMREGEAEETFGEPDRACVELWVGMYRDSEIPERVTVHVTRSKRIEADTFVVDCDGWVDDERGYDVLAVVPCREVRRLLRRPRRA